MTYDRLFWRRFEPIGPPQRRTSFTTWPTTIWDEVRQQRLVRCRSMCGPRFSPGRGFGQKSRRRSRDLAGTLPATTARARGGWSRKSAPEAAQCPPGTTFPAWPFLGPAASFAAGSSAHRLVERNGARQRRAAQPSAAPPRGRCSANSS